MWTSEQLDEFDRVLTAGGCKEPGRVLRVIARLAAFYGEKHLGPEKATMYAEDLADLDPGALERAVADLRKTSTFLPSVAEIRGRCTVATLAAAGVKCSAEDAWAEVLRKVRSCGTNRVPGKDTEHGPAVTFDDPVTASFLDATSWRALGQATTDQLPSERRVFIERYRAHSARLRHEVQTGRALPPSSTRAALAPAGEP